MPLAPFPEDVHRDSVLLGPARNPSPAADSWATQPVTMLPAPTTMPSVALDCTMQFVTTQRSPASKPLPAPSRPLVAMRRRESSLFIALAAFTPLPPQPLIEPFTIETLVEVFLTKMPSSVPAPPLSVKPFRSTVTLLVLM